MKHIFSKGAFASLILSVSCFVNVAYADLILEVDLTVPNTITINATSGLSSITTSGSTNTGFYLADLFGSTGNELDENELGTGTLTSSNSQSNSTPWIYRDDENDTGLNVYDYTSNYTDSFVIDTVAFVGSAYWTVSSVIYNDLLAGPTFGNVWFAADDISDLASADVLGTWAMTTSTSVPEPASIALLGLGLIGIGFSRKKKIA